MQSASITKGIAYRESRRVCVRMSHTVIRYEHHTGRIVVEDEWHSEGRVDPFTIYSQRPMGFPSVSRALSHSPTSGVAFAKSSSEMVDALVEGKIEGEKGKLGHVAGGVSEGVARTTSHHDNLVLSRPAGSEGR